MRIISCLIICSFLQLQSAFGQYLSEKAYKYYACINKAELALCNDNLPQAYTLYEQAMKENWEHPIGRDLLNAFYCAMDTRHYSHAEKYLARMLYRGVGPDFIKDNLLSFYEGEDRIKIKEILGKYPNDTVKSNKVFKTVKLMLEMDQRLRRYFRERDNTGNYMTETVFSLDASNGMKLKDLIVQGGFPTEDTVGTTADEPAHGNRVSLVYLHFRGGAQVNKPYQLLDSLFLDAVQKLKFDVKAFIADISAAEEPFIVNKMQIHFPLSIDIITVFEDSTIYPQYFSPAEEHRINRERKSLGLESLDELRRKVIFAHQQQLQKGPYKKYLLGTGIVAYIDAETKAEVKKRIAEFQKYKPE